MPLFWPSISTVPTWTSSQTITATTSATNAIWQSSAQTASTSTVWVTPIYYQQQAQLAMQQNAYERYLWQPSSGWQSLVPLYRPTRPAILTHWNEERGVHELYRRAVAEHDEQEAARLLRQIEARARTVAEHRRLIAEQEQSRHERQQQTDAARLRARELLIEHLTPQQRETFDSNGWFVVEGGRSKTQYRIRAVESMVANVDVLKEGKRIHRLCAHVRVGTVPLGDQLLAQKVMIELAEDDFLRIANRHAA